MSPTRATPELQSLPWTEGSHYIVTQTAFHHYLGSSIHHFLLPELEPEQGRAWSVLALEMTALTQASVFHKG